MDAYILDFDANRYRHFDVADLADDDRLEPFDGSPMASTWQPVKVKMTKPNRKRPQGDLSAIGLPEVLSARAADALGDLLLGRCELLPSTTPTASSTRSTSRGSATRSTSSTASSSTSPMAE